MDQLDPNFFVGDDLPFDTYLSYKYDLIWWIVTELQSFQKKSRNLLIRCVTTSPYFHSGYAELSWNKTISAKGIKVASTLLKNDRQTLGHNDVRAGWVN